MYWFNLVIGELFTEIFNFFNFQSPNFKILWLYPGVYRDINILKYDSTSEN